MLSLNLSQDRYWVMVALRSDRTCLLVPLRIITDAMQSWREIYIPLPLRRQTNCWETVLLEWFHMLYYLLYGGFLKFTCLVHSFGSLVGPESAWYFRWTLIFTEFWWVIEPLIHALLLILGFLNAKFSPKNRRLSSIWIFLYKIYVIEKLSGGVCACLIKET